MLEYFEKLCIFSSTRSLYSGKLQSVRSIALLRPSFAFIICLVLKPKLWKAYFFISSSDQMHLPGAAGFFCGRPFSEWGPAVRVYWKWSKEEMLLTQRFVVSLAIFFANCTFLTFCVFFSHLLHSHCQCLLSKGIPLKHTSKPFNWSLMLFVF